MLILYLSSLLRIYIYICIPFYFSCTSSVAWCRGVRCVLIVKHYMTNRRNVRASSVSLTTVNIITHTSDKHISRIAIPTEQHVIAMLTPPNAPAIPQSQTQSQTQTQTQTQTHTPLTPSHPIPFPSQSLPITMV